MQRKLAEILEEDGDGQVRIYENYSGRGMFGQTTVGIVVDQGCDLAGLIYNAAGQIAAAKETGELDEFCGTIRQDSMGHDTIYY